MAADEWVHAVRQQLGLGRLLPLGGPKDGAWITERAASDVLRGAVAPRTGVRFDRLRIGLADAGSAVGSAVPAPPSALPTGPLSIEADFAAPLRLPLQATSQKVREALLTAADERLGLTVVEVDLRVTDLLETPSSTKGPESRPGPPAGEPAGEPEPHPEAVAVPLAQPGGEVAAAAVAVPGVTRLAAALSGPAVRVEDRDHPERRHVQVQLAIAAGHRALDVARAVRTAVTIAAALDAPGPVTVAVVVTAVDTP
ncbi:nucleopolyhedrovirus P10 family protein [Streptomyces sp. 8N706]|uniref:nucleopolyhedrovirus P10 family protein n=1 Tax=Streptomyces sp. 8N706 TaxID=3457416 RepID=UPI003FD4185E